MCVCVYVVTIVPVNQLHMCVAGDGYSAQNKGWKLVGHSIKIGTLL